MAKGAWDMWRARAVSDFNDAKHMLYIGAGVLLIVWFAFFTVIGGAFCHVADQAWGNVIGRCVSVFGLCCVGDTLHFRCRLA